MDQPLTLKWKILSYYICSLSIENILKNKTELLPQILKFQKMYNAFGKT